MLSCTPCGTSLIRLATRGAHCCQSTSINININQNLSTRNLSTRQKNYIIIRHCLEAHAVVFRFFSVCRIGGCKPSGGQWAAPGTLQQAAKKLRFSLVSRYPAGLNTSNCETAQKAVQESCSPGSSARIFNFMQLELSLHLLHDLPPQWKGTESDWCYQRSKYKELLHPVQLPSHIFRKS